MQFQQSTEKTPYSNVCRRPTKKKYNEMASGHKFSFIKINMFRSREKKTVYVQTRERKIDGK